MADFTHTTCCLTPPALWRILCYGFKTLSMGCQETFAPPKLQQIGLQPMSATRNINLVYTFYKLNISTWRVEFFKGEILRWPVWEET